MSTTPFDKVISRESSPIKSAVSPGTALPVLSRVPTDPFIPHLRSGSVSPTKQPSLPPSSTSPSRMSALPSNAAIDLVIANAMANAPAPPQLGIMDQNARIGNEITRIRTPSAINNLFPAAVGIDGRVNLFVGNLPYRVRWQDLKDLFRRAGTVLRADVSLGQDNRSRGYGTVLMGSREDGAKAIDLFNGFNWQTRTLEVRPDRLPPEYEPQVTHHPQHPPFQPSHMPPSMYPPHFQSQPQFNHFHHPQQAFFRSQPFNSSPGNAFQHMGLPHQNALTPMSTGPPPLHPQYFTPRHDAMQSYGLPHQAVVPPRTGSFSSLINGSEVQPRLSPAEDEPIPLGRTDSLSPVVGAIGEKLSPALAEENGPASSNGSSSGKAALPTGLGPLPSSVFSPILSSVTPDTSASNERPFGALGNGGMIRPPVGAPAGLTTGRVLFIHNLPFQCQWQDLKDLLRPAGSIVRADVALGPDNRSRGYGTVLFASEADAQNAVRMFDGYEYQGRAIKVYIDRNNDRHSTMPNQGPPRMANQFQPYPQFPQPFMAHHPSPFGHPSPGLMGPRQTPETQPEVSPTKQAADLPSARGEEGDGAEKTKSSRVPLSVDISAAASHANGNGGESNGSGRSGSGKAPHPGPLTMPSYPNFSNGNPLSPLLTRGLPPMTPSMPGFVFNAYPQTPPLHPPFMSPGFAPFSPGAPVTSPNVYSYNPFMNAAPGAPITQPGGPPGAPPGRWNGYTASAGLRTPQGQSNGNSNGDYFSGSTLPKLDTSVVNSANNSANASPLNAKTRFTSITPAAAAAGPLAASPELSSALEEMALAPSTPGNSPTKVRAGNRSSIDYTKRSLAAAWEGGPVAVSERRASDAA